MQNRHAQLPFLACQLPQPTCQPGCQAKKNCLQYGCTALMYVAAHGKAGRGMQLLNRSAFLEEMCKVRNAWGTWITGLRCLAASLQSHPRPVIFTACMCLKFACCECDGCWVLVHEGCELFCVSASMHRMARNLCSMQLRVRPVHSFCWIGWVIISRPAVASVSPYSDVCLMLPAVTRCSVRLPTHRTELRCTPASAGTLVVAYSPSPATELNCVAMR